MCKHKNTRSINKQIVCIILGCPETFECDDWDVKATEMIIVCLDCGQPVDGNDRGNDDRETVFSTN